ncbi:TonB-dependent receptor [Massilia sp. TS11]|uniref:TonB-dependent receptor n=1 Tax=Massilia sp. TS11 TaxID=2908003 RepID=UPI001ED9D53F|nr:carboxypeptidase regulatory-like domain-containing protein [Massilia sp. TS11]MCG2586096.1 carboxypeptidase regulatory-like domain-containing protein [Massilia sp. TS11]
MIDKKRIRLTKLAFAMAIALSAAPSFAQNTTSALGGRITGADGKPAAGAQVQIIHAESGSISNVVTDGEGRYIARGLRVGGPYTIVITKDGVSKKEENVYVQLAETTNLDASLQQQMQVVTVTGSAARSEKFSRSNMGAVTNIGQTELVSQASINRNLQDYARNDPRVSQTDKERGEMSVAGQNSRYNSLTIDGVAVNDTFGLEANGSPTLKQPISIEAIQSVQVNVSNYDVTQKGYTGANVNAVTKSGTNNWKGGVYYVFRNDRLAGDRYNSSNDTFSPPAAFEESTKGVNFGGPLIKDTLFLYALFEEFKSTRTAPAFSPIGGNFTTVGITQSLISSAQNIAKTNYNTDIGTVDVPKGTQLSSRDTLLKMDWNINDSHKAMLRYAKTEQSEPIFPGLSTSGISLSSQWYSQVKSIETLVGQLLSDWTPSFSTELKLSSRDYDSVPLNNSRLPTISLQITGALPSDAPAGTPTGSRFLNIGTERSRHFNVLGTKTTDAYAGGNWSIGDHEVKFGTDYSSNKIYNAFLQDVNGNYTFSCQNSSATYTYSFGAINCGTATAAQIEAAVLENFRIGRPSTYSVQVPIVGGTLNDAIAQFTLKNTGLFLQDTWNVNSNLTLTYGVRVDELGVNGRPKANAAAAAPMVPGRYNGTTAVLQTGGFGYDNTVTPDGKKLFQPRFGFNYKLDTARATQIRGGAGLFMGAAANVWISNIFSNPGVATRVIGCGGSNPACPTTGGLFSVNPDTQPTPAAATPAANVDFLDPNFRQPSVWKSNLAFEHELPRSDWFGTLVVGGEFMYTKNKNAITYQYLNLGAPTKTGSDGRDLFWSLPAYNPACWNASGSLSTSGACAGSVSKALKNKDFNNVLLATNTDGGRGKVFTAYISRPSAKGLSWSASYTRTDATEVSPLTSSVSNSNWAGRSVFNPNENVEANSAYMIKDRVNMNLTWSEKYFGNYFTRLGVFFEGRKGVPYSWTINNDMNGDGLGGNDLMYIPRAPGSGDVIFQGDSATSHANEDKFWSIVNSIPSLKDAAGTVVKRNSAFAPWTNQVDLRVTQELPGLMKGHKGTFQLDFFNFGNLLNKRWGRIPEVGFQSNGGKARSFVDYGGIDPASGKYVYIVRSLETVDLRQAKGESQWAIQATLKYDF